jgi:uncharacterized membrane protein YhhN
MNKGNCFGVSCYRHFTGVSMMFFFGGLFIIDSILHLTGCITGSKKLCTVTKPLLMPLLAATAAVILIPELPESRSTLICTSLALLFGTAGDILLLYTDTKHFISGALCFLAGHVFWIVQYAPAFSTLPRMTLFIGIACAAVYLAAVYIAAGKPADVMGAGIMIYGAALCTLVLTGVAAVNAHHTTASGLFLSGALLFLASDSMIGYTVMKRKFPLSDFFIMATYIAAQALLTAGVVLPLF